MKKKILVLALALVIVAAAVVCVSCAKKEEPQTVKVSYTIVNNTGKNVTETTLSDQKSSNKLESKAGEGGLPDGQSTGIEMEVTKEKDMIDVMFSYTVEGGDSMMGPIVKENGTITLKLTDDGKLDFVVE
jgi:hypothetical protein